MEREFLSLCELQSLIRQELETAFPGRVWVKAEINALQARTNGHCYIDLVQSENGMVVAKARAMAWRNVWLQISRHFETVAGTSLKEGMSVLLEVGVSYSEVWGFCLMVNDIDAEFTLGEHERKRQETINRLKKEGLLERQKSLVLPSLPYHIAVISSPDGAGFRDFCRHIDNNEYGFVFEVTLFPATVQGDGAPASVAAAFRAIEDSGLPYDCVMLMRGGGGKMDMACFDEYMIAEAIALCPIPVITGIGHDQDFHVADMAACHYVKTPTALADWLIEIYASEDESLAYYSTRLRLAFMNKVASMESKVNLLETRIKAADPRSILSRGYTLTLDSSGKVSRSVKDFRKGEEIRILFPDGEIKAIVK